MYQPDAVIVEANELPTHLNRMPPSCQQREAAFQFRPGGAGRSSAGGASAGPLFDLQRSVRRTPGMNLRRTPGMNLRRTPGMTAPTGYRGG